MCANQLKPRVLVVDDEPAVLEVLAGALAVDGYRVDTASNGRIALEKLREERYALIFSDLRMPDLDGIGLYRMLERDDPHLCQRIIFVTGYGLSEDIELFVRETGVPILWKPFRLADVRWIARLMLGEGQG